MRPFTVLAAGMLVVLFATPFAADAQSRDAPIPYDVGQSASPSFEGWYPNDDGSFSLSFGYFNRNYEQTLDIPIGPANHFTAGPEDRGQPTHLLPRRHTGVFTVVVPADFGDRTLTWSLTAGGETFAVPGHLRPEWRIDALEEVTSGNRPPELSFDADEGETRVGQGPGGVRQSLTAAVGAPLTLAIRVRDDRVQKQSLQGRPTRMGLVWSKYRGPGTVEIADPAPEIPAGGLTTTSVTFGEPGDYVLRALAWDDSGGQGAIMAGGFQCCWTNAYVDVRVE
ncbi:MAG: hypothetical protein F4137_19550 [Acidobacteria bacterium]|nr:hypothetical protein [Acidobacteriota bacterium]